jgi:hypothetical protein
VSSGNLAVGDRSAASALPQSVRALAGPCSNG